MGYVQIVKELHNITKRLNYYQENNFNNTYDNKITELQNSRNKYSRLLENLQKKQCINNLNIPHNIIENKQKMIYNKNIRTLHKADIL